MKVLTIAKLGDKASTGQAKSELIIPTHEALGELSHLMKAAKEQFDFAFNAYTKSVEHVWMMGKLLTEAKAAHKSLKKVKGKTQPNWEDVLKQFGISVPSDNRARRVFKEFPQVEQISGMSIMQAYEAAGIPKASSRKSDTDQNQQSNPVDHDADISIDDGQTADGDVEDEDDDLDDDVYRSNFLEHLQDFDRGFTPLCQPHKAENLLDEEIDEAIRLLEQIADNALEIKIRLEERLGKSSSE